MLKISKEKAFKLRKNVFDAYLEKVMNFPLWVKQVIYVKLKENLRELNCAEFLDKSPDKMFSLYVPVLTFAGREELLKKKSGLDANIYTFLKLCSVDYSVLDISLSMFLTMEETAKYFVFCVDQNYIEFPASDEIYAMAGFISGKFKTGEYFQRNKTLSMRQVQEGLNEQKKVDSSGGKHLKYLEILDTMGLVKEDDYKIIFTLKEEAKKRFVIDYNLVPDSERAFSNAEEKESAEIEALKAENKKLKEKLTQLLRLVKKDV